MIGKYICDLRAEFVGYDAGRFGKDAMAGLTVAAVALPLALAFGVSSGADAAAGLITAILSGFIMSMLSGASYQISGPTGAMTAVLVTIVSRYGLQGVFLASLMAGIILFICGLFKFGKLVGFIPSPVVTGFTSGIAVIIALGQIDNFFGTHSVGETAVEKLLSYGQLGFLPDFRAVIIGLIVVAVMILWPKKWGARFPSSLAGIIIAGIVSNVAGFDIAVVGDIPKTLLPQNRLLLSSINVDVLQSLMAPALTIASLGMIESLLCGASASRMKQEGFDADRELVSQGIGNMVIPFFGGVPSTAAIARTSVAIKSGGQTRLTGVIHAVGLLASMFLLGDIMSRLPLAALAGVLMVTAFRMNEWESIRYIFGRRFKGAMSKFIITMAATIVFDLTVAILMGVAFSILMFVVRASNIEITVAKVDLSRLRQGSSCHPVRLSDASVVYVTGPLFFTTISRFSEQVMEGARDSRELIFSMRGVTTMDTSGVQAVKEMCQELKNDGKVVVFCGVQDRIREYMDRAGVTELIGEENFYFSVDRALLDASESGDCLSDEC